MKNSTLLCGIAAIGATVIAVVFCEHSHRQVERCERWRA